MHCIVVLGAVCVLAVTFQQGQCQTPRPAVVAAQEVCIKETGVAMEVIERAKQKDLQSDDRKLQCYTKCMLQKIKVMDANGKLDTRGFLEGMQPKAKAAYTPIMQFCQKEVNDDTVEKDLCKRGMKLYECMLKTSGERYFFI